MEAFAGRTTTKIFLSHLSLLFMRFLTFFTLDRMWSAGLPPPEPARNS